VWFLAGCRTSRLAEGNCRARSGRISKLAVEKNCQRDFPNYLCPKHLDSIEQNNYFENNFIINFIIITFAQCG
jgi:hypothetical protein